MYNRYHDIRKFITDPEKLQMMNGSEVYISSEEDYDIVVDLEGHTEELSLSIMTKAFSLKSISTFD